MAETIRNHLRQTLRLAAPAAVAQLGLVAMGVVDTAMVGPLGAAELGAVGLGNSLFFTPAAACMGVMMALDPMVAQAFGAGRRRDCGAAFNQVLRLGVWLSVPLALVVAGLGGVLAAIGIEPEVVGHADAYLRILAFSAPLMLLFVALRSFLQGLGKTRPALVAVGIGNVVNVVLNWALIYGHLGFPAMGVAGSAISTVVSRLMMVLTLGWIVYGGRRHAEFGVPGADTRVDWRLQRMALRLGLPIGGHMLAEVGTFSLVALAMGWLGARSLAAHQMALMLAAVAFMFAIGIGTAAGIRVGHAVGARDRAGASRAAWVGIGLGAAVMSISATAFALFPEVLARLFTPDEALIAAGASLLRIAALFQLADGIQGVAAGCLRGAGDTRYPLRVHVLAGLMIGFPLGCGLAFGLGLGASGLWWGLTAALVIAALMLMWRLRSGVWWDHRLADEGEQAAAHGALRCAELVAGPESAPADDLAR